MSITSHRRPAPPHVHTSWRTPAPPGRCQKYPPEDAAERDLQQIKGTYLMYLSTLHGCPALRLPSSDLCRLPSAHRLLRLQQRHDGSSRRSQRSRHGSAYKLYVGGGGWGPHVPTYLPMDCARHWLRHTAGLGAPRRFSRSTSPCPRDFLLSKVSTFLDTQVTDQPACPPSNICSLLEVVEPDCCPCLPPTRLLAPATCTDSCRP